MSKRTAISTQQLSLKCLSLNVKGLNIPEKRTQVLSALTKHKAHFLLLQETHFCAKHIPKLSNHLYKHALHSTNPTAKTKGVSILISKHADFQLKDSLIDQEGRYIFIKGTYALKPITIANVYCPNDHQVTFFRQICDLLSTFQEGILLLGGDFNVPLNPNLDSSTGTSALPYRALRQIKLQLQNLTLHDSWRTMHPTDKIIHSSPPHTKNTRELTIYFYPKQT